MQEMGSDFIKLPDSSTTTFPPFEVNGLEPSAICGAWLPTDHNLFSVCYEGAHVVFYDTSKGVMVGEWVVEAPAGSDAGDKLEITCMATHSLEPILFVGLASGDFITYDYRQHKQSQYVDIKALGAAGASEENNQASGPKALQASGAVQSIELINNGLQLVVGY